MRRRMRLRGLRGFGGGGVEVRCCWLTRGQVKSCLAEERRTPWGGGMSMFVLKLMPEADRQRGI
jgi:hypothetical protein